MLSEWLEHWFWFGLTAAALLWYTTITVYVGVRGGYDIRGMLNELKKGHGKPKAEE